MPTEAPVTSATLPDQRSISGGSSIGSLLAVSNLATFNSCHLRSYHFYAMSLYVTVQCFQVSVSPSIAIQSYRT